ncbi:MAG: (Fe-S)-binding protein [Chloroflexi bacterium]|nr:(Fe-S)-binding protein [Chloroflexota bacterium]
MVATQRTLEPDLIAQVLKRFAHGKVASCIQCGVCSGSCPVGDIMEFAPRMSIAAIRAGQPERVVFSNTPWLCVGCLTCVSRCPASVEIAEELVPSLREAIVMQGTDVPDELQDVFESTARYGNPLGESRRRRADWARDITPPVTVLDKTEAAVDVLWLVDCYPSYHTRVQATARSLARTLNALGVSFGILGAQETCAGDNCRLAGEVGLFESLAEQNMKAMNKQRFSEIIVTDPHAYNALKNEYPRFGLRHPVSHYTEFLAARLDALKPLLSKSLDKTVTFHDPCYLGRKNDVYDEPRQLMAAVPGLKLVEMPRNRENSFCCGGGAGGMWLDTYVSEYSQTRLSEKRVVEAANTGAEILAVACPLDMLRFEDAIKTQGLEDRLVVKDILELVTEAMEG